jgi:hypothetical protein
VCVSQNKQVVVAARTCMPYIRRHARTNGRLAAGDLPAAAAVGAEMTSTRSRRRAAALIELAHPPYVPYIAGSPAACWSTQCTTYWPLLLLLLLHAVVRHFDPRRNLLTNWLGIDRYIYEMMHQRAPRAYVTYVLLALFFLFD